MLLVVDAQVNQFEPPMAVHDGPAILRRLKELVSRARAARVPVAFVQNDGGEIDPDFPGTPGWALHPDLLPTDGERVYRKTTTDSFHETGLLEDLRAAGITELVIAGMQSNHCIDATTRRAASEGFAVTLVIGLVATLGVVFALVFWFVRVDNILVIFQTMYEAGRWPVTIYPGWMQIMLTFLVPVAFAVTVPSEAVVGRLTAQTLLGALGVAALMLFVGRRVIPAILHYVAHTGSRELFRLAVLSVALTVAFLAAEAGNHAVPQRDHQHGGGTGGGKPGPPHGLDSDGSQYTAL